MAGLVVDPDEPDGRYGRQELITWWRQDRLSEAHLLVAGAGALGNELVKNLALVGVGHITVVDFDRIEASNLARCVFFRDEDVGRAKAEVVAARAAEINPEVQIDPIVGDLRAEIGVAGYRDFDLVLGGLDSREARLHVNTACWKTRTPFVDGAIEGLLGVARVFLPPGSACYECTLGKTDRQLLANRKACALLSEAEVASGKTPTTATTASVIAGVQVQETLKLLHDAPGADALVGKGFFFNGMTHDSYVVSYPRDEDCLSHDEYNLDTGEEVMSSESVAGLLERGVSLLGPQATLDFEQDLVTGFYCRECERLESTLVSTLSLSPDAANCPGCGRERQVTTTHSISSTTGADLGRSLGELALPPGDVITARDGAVRKHLVLSAAAL